MDFGDKIKRRAMESLIVPMIEDLDLTEIEQNIISDVEKMEIKNGEQYNAGLLFAKNGRIWFSHVTMSAENKVVDQKFTILAQDGIKLIIKKL